MNRLSFYFIILFVGISFAQEKTYSRAELDSLANDGDSKSFKIIENVPVYKGCENELSNAAKKQCMSQKIALLFKQNFNTVIPKDSELSPGLERVFLTFNVDIDGKVTDIDANASAKFLIQEAIRVAQLIPQLKPGYARGVAVKVPFSLPLKINLEASETTNTKFPVFRGCDESLSNEELKKCSIRKIKNFIKMSFDTGIANVALPQDKTTQFQLDFIINEKGKIEQVNAKANHRAIAIEAIKTAKRLPKFKKPGLRDGKAVETPFSLLMTIYF